MVNLKLVSASALLFVVLGSCDTFVGLQDPSSGTDIFHGVPYASRLTRLQPPVPLSGNQGYVLAMNATSNRCFELGPDASSTIAGSEDCLTLDIVRPSSLSGSRTPSSTPVIVETGKTVSNATKLLPVYVFFHGGGFNSGDKSDYDGRNLVRASINLGSPIIYVAVNYRLGFLGFPGGKEAESRNGTNLGLLDQRQSLIWLQQMIKYFGGDSKKVVIGGQEAGADSVAYHMLAYAGKSNDLFRGVILHSGSATSSSPIPRPDYTAWQHNYDEVILEAVCTGSLDPWACLQKAPIEKVVKAYTKVFNDTKSASPASVFSPVVDGKFLPDYPSVLMKQGAFAHVPMLIGVTTDEVVKSVPIYTGFGTNASIITFLRPAFPYVSDATFQQLLSLYPVSHFYNTGPPLSGSQFTRVVAVVNDLQVFCPTTEQALQVSNVANVFKYRWDATLQSVKTKPWQGVPQSSELRYLFPFGADMTKQSAGDLALIASFHRAIVSFVSTLHPTKIPNLDGTTDIWPQFNSLNQVGMHFGPPRDMLDGQPLRAGGVETYTFINNTICDFISSKNLEFLR